MDLPVALNPKQSQAKKERIFKSHSNIGKPMHSRALSQIMTKIKTNILWLRVLLLSRVVCNKKQNVSFIAFICSCNFVNVRRPISKPFTSPSEPAQPTVALPCVPDFAAAKLIYDSFFLLSTPKTAPKDPTVASTTSLAGQHSKMQPGDQAPPLQQPKAGPKYPTVAPSISQIKSEISYSN